MSRKIATPSAVFTACDTLEISGKPWNRDDVRFSVGGGGYSVIDPLIRAWRQLQPVREIAGATPTDLLYQVARSLEEHIGSFTAEAEKREMERVRIFESACRELEETIRQLEQQTEELTASNTGLTGECARLTDKAGALHQQLHHRDQELARLQTRNDELTGQTQRLEKQLHDQIAAQQEALRSLENKQEAQLSCLMVSHREELRQQKEELIKQAETSENRWMRLLDQERTDFKKQTEQQHQKLEKMRLQEQEIREQKVELAARGQQLQAQAESAQRAVRELNDTLTAERSRCAALLKEKSTLYGAEQFEELKATVSALRERLDRQP